VSEQPSSAHWQLQSIVTGLRGAREQWRTRNGRSIGEQGGRELPSREAMRQILEQLCGALFPMRLGRWTCAKKAKTSTSAIPSMPR
jgi:serine O-acetyltransferase